MTTHLPKLNSEQFLALVLAAQDDLGLGNVLGIRSTTARVLRSLGLVTIEAKARRVLGRHGFEAKTVAYYCDWHATITPHGREVLAAL